MGHSAKDDPMLVGIGCVILAVCVIFSGYWFYNRLDSMGMISHREDTFISAQSDWPVGESKLCQSITLVAPLEGKEAGYALSSLHCDNGPQHHMEIRFWGREEQPEYVAVDSNCTREEVGFTCREVSGVRPN
jgi:hypothetical protein